MSDCQLAPVCAAMHIRHMEILVQQPVNGAMFGSICEGGML
jgi:hypothetical protein